MIGRSELARPHAGIDAGDQHPLREPAAQQIEAAIEPLAPPVRTTIASVRSAPAGCGSSTANKA